MLLWIQKLGPGNCWDTKEEGRGGSSQEPERELTREKQTETLEQQLQKSEEPSQEEKMETGRSED